MPAIETVRGFTVPTVAGDVGVWGGELNTTINELAAILGSQTVFNSSTVGSNTTVTSSQAQSARLIVINTSSSPFQLNLPSSNFANGQYNIGYASSQAQPLTITGGSSVAGGLTAVIPGSSLVGSSNPTERLVYADGIGNVFFADPQTAPVLSVGGLTGVIALGNAMSSSAGVLAVFTTAPTVQSFLTAGSTTYFPAAFVQRIRVRMAGGGGGGGADSINNGSAGTDTSFGAWTAIHGNGGVNGGGAGGAGGTGGANGTGTLIARLTGGAGVYGTQGAGFVQTTSGSGGNNPFFGGAGAGVNNATGGNGVTNTGGGGGGGGGSPGTGNSGGGGGAGEYVEFWVTSPSSGGIALTVGGGGSGGAPGLQQGGSGAAGRITIEEFYI